MFKKVNRLMKDSEFDNVFKNGKSSYDKILGIKIIKNQLNYNRFGILVNTRVSKKAVERNKIKRRIREIIRLQLNNIIPSCDVVIIVLPNAFGKSFLELKQSIYKHFYKLGIMNRL